MLQNPHPRGTKQGRRDVCALDHLDVWCAGHGEITRQYNCFVKTNFYVGKSNTEGFVQNPDVLRAGGDDDGADEWEV
jgi:hypothetical protein